MNHSIVHVSSNIKRQIFKDWKFYGKRFLVFFLMLAVKHVNAQETDLGKLIETEKAFAVASKTANTRDAFLSYLSDSGIIFKKGEAVNGKEFYTKKQADSSLLWWKPEFADISSDGALGFTTGPWLYKRNRKDTAALAFGHYFTIWQKQDEGKFKMAVDLGVSHDKVNFEPDLKTKHFTEIKNIQDKPPYPNYPELQSLDEKFSQAYARDPTKAYTSFAAEKCLLYRPGEYPFASVALLSAYIKQNEELLKFELKKSFVSGDMGYSYGNVMITVKDKEQKQTLNGNYLHVWQMNKKGEWKLMAEVVSL